MGLLLEQESSACGPLGFLLDQGSVDGISWDCRVCAEGNCTQPCNRPGTSSFPLLVHRWSWWLWAVADGTEREALSGQRWPRPGQL